ncbi:MAG TPA: BatA domain-containing protein [Isosphaeraceae bacterium]|jgi:hypothetical protein|nr:BatA domain-containing protein [Isosphaeraceae bacterium]
MTFLSQGMLWGVAAAAIPLALHLLFRSRHRTVPWGAMAFLLASLRQTSRRLKFRELLLLLARVGVIALLALALARPAATAGRAGRGDAIDAAIVIDTSYSMAARDGATARLDRAKQAALAVLDRLPIGSTVRIITCSDRARTLGPLPAGRLDRARAIVSALAVEDRPTDLLPGVRAAADALKGAANRELYLVGDMQRAGWDRQASALTKAFAEIHTSSGLSFIRCGAATPNNVEVVGLDPQGGIVRVGERAGFTVLVRNAGPAPARDLTVTLAIDGADGDRNSAPIALLGPGEARAITLTAVPDRAGPVAATATVGPDDLPNDNVYSRVFAARDRARVLVVEGPPSSRRPGGSASFFLAHALGPVADSESDRAPVTPLVVPAQDAAPALLDGQDACILADVPVGTGVAGDLRPDFLDRLARFVRDGGGLLIFAGSHVDPDRYNPTLGAGLGLLPARLETQETRRPRHFDPTSIDPHSPLAPFRVEPLDRLARVEIRQSVGLKQDRPLLCFDDGTPAMAAGAVGSGTVLVVATGPDLRGSDWPLHPTFPAFVQATLPLLLRDPARGRNLAVGAPIDWSAPAGPIALVRPDGRREAIPFQRMNDQAIAHVSETDRAGLYRLEAPGARATFAVVADRREGEDLEALNDAEIDRRLGFRAVHLDGDDDPGAAVGLGRARRDWGLWVLAATVLAFAAETALAWLSGRPA